MGALVQIDASPFAWLQDRRPRVGAARGDRRCHRHGVGLGPAARPRICTATRACWSSSATRYGLPLALYGDRLNVFVRNDPHWTLDEQLRGTQAPTHFGRMLQALGIGFITAHSPQAKGRIERFWQTLQDRLVSELRLRGRYHPRGRHRLFPGLSRGSRRALCPRPGRADRRLAPGPARSRRRAELSLHPPRRPGQYRGPRPSLGPVAGPPVLCRPPPRAARVPGRAPARLRRRPLPRRPARPAPAFVLRPRQPPSATRRPPPPVAPPRRVDARPAPAARPQARRAPRAAAPTAAHQPSPAHPWRHAATYAIRTRG